MAIDQPIEKKYSGGFNINRSSIFLYLLLIPSLIAYHALDRAKLIYFIPAIMLTLFFLESFLSRKKEEGIKYEPNMLVALGLYTILMLIGLVLNYATLTYSIFIRDILIILSPLIVFTMKMNFDQRHIKWLFIATVISYFAWVGISMDFDLSFNLIRSNYNMSTEFHNGVIIGCFVLFFLNRKLFLWALVAILLVMMSGKRSIILGLIPSIITYYGFIKPLKIYDHKYLLASVLFIYFLSFYFIGLNLEAFSTWVFRTLGFGSEYSIDRFLMGRQIFMVYMKTHIAESEWLQYLFGYGPGSADIFVHDVVRPDWGSERRITVNPHNDFLKTRFDYGLIGSILLFLVFYASYTRTKMGIQIFLYTIPLFLVDNSFIFIYYWFIAMVVARFEPEKNI